MGQTEYILWDYLRTYSEDLMKVLEVGVKQNIYLWDYLRTYSEDLMKVLEVGGQTEYIFYGII